MEGFTSAILPNEVLVVPFKFQAHVSVILLERTLENSLAHFAPPSFKQLNLSIWMAKLDCANIREYRKQIRCPLLLHWEFTWN